MNKRKSVEIRTCNEKVKVRHRRSYSSCNLQQLLNTEVSESTSNDKPQSKSNFKMWQKQKSSMKITNVDNLEWSQRDLQKTQLNLKAFLSQRIYPKSYNQQELLLYKLQLLRNEEFILNTIRETSEKDFSIASISIDDCKGLTAAEFNYLNDSLTKKNFCKKKQRQLKKEAPQDDKIYRVEQKQQIKEINRQRDKKQNQKIDQKQQNTFSPIEQRKTSNSKKINFPQIGFQDFPIIKPQKVSNFVLQKQQSKITETTQEFSEAYNYERNSLTSLLNQQKFNGKLSLGRKLKTLQSLVNHDSKLKTFSIKNLLKQTQERKFFKKNLKKKKKEKIIKFEMNHKFCKKKLKKQFSSNLKKVSMSKKRQKKSINYSQKLKKVKNYSTKKLNKKSVKKIPKVFQKSLCIQRLLELKKQQVQKDFTIKLKSSKF